MDTTSASPSSRPTWLLPVVSIGAVVLLVIALVVVASRSDSDSSSDPISTAPTTPIAPTDAPSTVVSTTVAPTTDVPTTTAPPATTVPATTIAPATSAPPTTAPAPTTVPDPAPFTADAPFFGPVTLDWATSAEGLTIFDGPIVDTTLRCVVITAPSITGWHEWCGEAGSPTRFLTTDGTDMWLVEVGADIGSVSVSVPPAEWTLTSNGCTSPVFGLLTATFTGPAVMTGAICVPGEAFVSNSAVFLQPGPADGGGSVVEQAADGSWTSNGGGTSYPCEDALPDGIDRCELYGLTTGNELFQALLPIPPIGGGSSTSDIVALRDATADVQAAAGAALTPADIGNAVAAAFRDGTEDPAPTVQTFGGFGFVALQLVVVDIPAFDDSILKTTFVIWVRVPPGADPVARAFAFETCARGMAGSDLCI